MPSVASSGMQFDGTSATLRHFVTLCLSVCVSILVYPVLTTTSSDAKIQLGSVLHPFLINRELNQNREPKELLLSVPG